jgi:S-adenosylmethionine synthetase
MWCGFLGAANRSPDSVDANPEAARKINIDASRLLAKATTARSIVLIYICTDYVFPGPPGAAPYETDAKPAPTNLYGQTKLDGEIAVLEEAAGTGLGVSLRVPVLYGEATEPKESAVNVLMDAVWKAQEKDSTAKVDDWAIRYPTNTEDVGRVCADIAAKYTTATDRASLPKLLQFSSEDRYTMYEMCQVFAEIMGLPLDGLAPNKQGNDPNAKVQRPYDTHLSTKALRELGIEVHTQDFVAWWRREARAVRR